MRRFLRDASDSSRVRLAVLVTAAAALLAAPSAGAGSQAGCPTGFDLGTPTLTFADALNLPKVQAAITAGATTAADFTGFLRLIDKNGDGLVCAKNAPAGNGSGAISHQYDYNFTDNGSAATG